MKDLGELYSAFTTKQRLHTEREQKHANFIACFEKGVKHWSSSSSSSNGLSLIWDAEQKAVKLLGETFRLFCHPDLFDEYQFRVSIQRMIQNHKGEPIWIGVGSLYVKRGNVSTGTDVLGSADHPETVALAVWNIILDALEKREGDVRGN